MEGLTQAQHKAAEAMYRSAGAGAASPGGDTTDEGGGSGASRADGDVIDAEVVEEEKR